MAITISGENNNDRIIAQDGVIDEISGINIVGLLTAGHINVGSNIQLGNAGIITATTFNGNLTGNVNSTSPLLLQTGGTERFRITGNNELGIAGANYGSSGQVLTSGGSGSAVSWVTPAVTAFTNGSNNRVVTATSGSGLNGEANLTFDGTSLMIADGTKLGVNGAAPQTPIDVIANGSGYAINVRGRSSDNVGEIRFTSNNYGSLYSVIQTGATYLNFQVGSTANALRIDSDGDVIIGTSSWQYKKPLNVQGSSGHILSLYNGDTGTYAADTMSGIEFKLLTGNTGNQFGSCEIRAFKENGTNGNNARALSFYTGVNSGSPNERLRIDSSGNIKLSSDVLQTLAVKNYGYSSSYKSIMVGNPNSNSGTVALCVDVSAISGSNFHAQNQVITGYRGFLTPNAAGNNFIGVFARDASADKIYFGPSISSGLTNGPITATTSKVGINQNNPTTALLEIRNTGSAVQALDVYTNDTTTTPIAKFRGYDNTLGEVDRMVILANGNVGIGEAIPSSDVTFTVRKDVAAASGYATMQINNLYQGTANASNQSGAEIEFLFKNHNASHNWWGGRILCYNSDNYNQYTSLRFHTASQGNAVERMRLAHDGDLTLYGKDNAELKLKAGTTTGNGVIAFLNSSGTTKGNIFYDTDDNFMVFKTNGTASSNERIRITSGGVINCGHGSAINLHGSTTTGINLNGNGNSGQIIANASGNRALIIGRQASYGQVIEFFQGSNTNEAAITIPAADTLGFETNGTENFRVTSQGRVRIKCQDMDNDPWTTNRGVMIGDSSTGSTFSNGSATGMANNIIFANGNGLVGKISTNGSTTTYHTSSDYRVKENAVSISDGIARLKTLKPYKFNFKADPSTTLDGFFAHEVSSAVPEAVDGEKDELYTEDYLGYKVGDQKLQTLDSSKLIPLLTAALQEAITKIETLEARVAALEGS